ncbi:MAG: gamma-glutamyl-gamma-aminobutyrate hydrolase family protein [Stellaceae bacterium]
MSSRPLIGISCSTTIVNQRPLQSVAQKYVAAIGEIAGATPLLIPAAASCVDFDALVSRLDGLVFTGSRSNIEPRHYGGPPDPDGDPPEEDQRDLPRDAVTLPLIRAAIAADLPVLAICRGLQELNVALGGTLYRRVHEMDGRIDHRSRHIPVETRYDYVAHPVMLTEGGMLARLIGASGATVNSLHGQGIDRLASDLVVEAVAPDGQIEAARHRDAEFCLGVQWHPEHRAEENAFSRAIFAAWGEACRAYCVGRPMCRKSAISDARSAASRSPAM